MQEINEVFGYLGTKESFNEVMHLILDDIAIGNPSYNYKRPDKSNSFEIGCHTLLFEICCDQHT